MQCGETEASNKCVNPFGPGGASNYRRVPPKFSANMTNKCAPFVPLPTLPCLSA